MTHWALILFFTVGPQHRLTPVYRTGFATQAECEAAGRAAHAKYWGCGEVRE